MSASCTTSSVCWAQSSTYARTLQSNPVAHQAKKAFSIPKSTKFLRKSSNPRAGPPFLTTGAPRQWEVSRLRALTLRRTTLSRSGRILEATARTVRASDGPSLRHCISAVASLHSQEAWVSFKSKHHTTIHKLLPAPTVRQGSGLVLPRT